MFTLSRIDSAEDFLPWLELVYEQAGDSSVFFFYDFSDQEFNYPPLEQSFATVYGFYLGSIPAGWCQLSIRGKTLEIQGLFVRVRLRGRGLGHRALHQVENFAPQHVKWIKLKVHRSNPRAHRLYQQCKFLTCNQDRRSGFFCMRKRRRVGMRCGLHCQTRLSSEGKPEQTPRCLLLPLFPEHFKAG